MRLNAGPRYPRIGRLAVQFGVGLALAMGAAGSIVFVVARHQLINETDESLQSEQDKLIPPGQAAGTAAIAQRIAARTARRSISTKGYVLVGADGGLLRGAGLDIAIPKDGFSAVVYHNGTRKWHEGRALSSRLPDGGRLIIVEHSEIGEYTQQAMLAGLLILVVGGSLAGIGAAWVLAGQIVQRLARTLATADAIASGDLSRRIPVDGLDGIFAEQAISLNGMIDRMELMVRSQRQFSSHLAHDLRTPLTRLRCLLQENMPVAGSEDRHVLEKAERECRSIIAIFDALLRLSEIEAGRRPAAMAPVTLSGLIEDVAETMEPVVADAGSELAVGPLAVTSVLADTELIQQLLVNLLENVVLHTPKGTNSSIVLGREAGEAVITIADNGPGITRAERDRVLRPFERGYGDGCITVGSGLGLSIAQAIMRFHNGVLELGDNQPGLIVRLRFPALV